MNDDQLKQIPITALFLALGVIFPQFFHLLGLGAAFLPMFLPVMVGSMLVQWKFALLLGLFSPLISFILTGMPPIAPPVLPVLTAELIVIALFISIVKVHLRQSFWIALIGAIVFDRLLLFALVQLIAPLFGFDHPLFSLAIVASGIPGVVLQLTVVPAALYIIRQRFPQWDTQKKQSEY
ncbi:MAG: hypothetical protein GF313_09335 [Caldithrix sp.]|nr:hypothetical protein [Caldithrix sp.]